MGHRLTPRQVTSVALPLLAAVVVFVFAGPAAPPRGDDAPAPAPAAIGDARERPCGLLTSAEVGAVVAARFNDFQPDVAYRPEIEGSGGMCSYLGFRDSGTDVAEIGIVSTAALASERGRSADPRAVLDEVRARAGDVEVVEGMGDAALWAPALGVGEVWVRAGDALVWASVTRTGTVGDRDASSALARAVLAKLRAGAVRPDQT